MLPAINTGLNLLNTEYQTLQEKGVILYAFDKIQDRNPLHSSEGFKKKSNELKKRITILKCIKKRSFSLWRKKKDRGMRDRAVTLNKRIQYLEAKLVYMHYEERSQTLLKCAAPCNLILPGTGDIIRIAAYSFKFFNAISYWRKEGNLDEVRRVAQSVSLASVSSDVSKYAYGQFKNIRNYLTFSNFKAIFNY